MDQQEHALDLPVNLKCRKALCDGTHPCGKEEGHEGKCFCQLCEREVEGTPREG